VSLLRKNHWIGGGYSFFLKSEGVNMTIERYVSQTQQPKQPTLKSVSMLASNSEYHREERRERKRGFTDYIYTTLIMGSFPFYRPQKAAYNTGYQ
jgi:hypothetical protein